MTRSKAILFWALVSLLLSPQLASCELPRAEPTPVAPAEAEEVGLAFVEATGKVVPARWAHLGFRSPGLVTEVLVEEGQRVEAGQVLARLESSELEAALSQAQAALEIARAQLAGLESGVRPVELARGEVAADIARENVEAAELAVEMAQANVAAAESAVAIAQASLRELRSGPTADELEVARQQVEMAKAQLYAFQGQRDAVGGGRDRSGYQSGAYEAAEGQVMAAEWTVSIAELNHRILADGARPGQIAVAAAQVTQAEAAVDVAEAQEVAAQQQVAIAREQVRQAQAEIDLLKAPAREADLAAARARVSQAEAALQGAQAALGKTVLVAPFTGTVTQVDLHAGEYVMMGVSVIALGDLATLWVETTDLDEIDVARVAEGRKATLALDALPDVKLQGTVQSIALKSSPGGGGTAFKVIITFDEIDQRLRWGMTAFVDIHTE